MKKTIKAPRGYIIKNVECGQIDKNIIVIVYEKRNLPKVSKSN